MAFIRCIGSNGGGGGAQVDTGTFTSSSQQYGIVTINCGFQPDLVMVTLPFDGVDTTSFWWREASWNSTMAQWDLLPAEWSAYPVDLGRQYGETGIQQITSNGFTFMSNAWNTQGVVCKYIAIKYT